MKKIMLIILCGMIFSGCKTISTSPQLQYDEPTPTANSRMHILNGYRYKDYEFEIISDPPGAKIEWNNDYLGTTPLRRIFNGDLYYSDMISVVAYPVEPGQYRQYKILLGKDPLPRAIYFNMNLAPQTPEYNINIKK